VPGVELVSGVSSGDGERLQSVIACRTRAQLKSQGNVDGQRGNERGHQATGRRVTARSLGAHAVAVRAPAFLFRNLRKIAASELFHLAFAGRLDDET
jgi:hypothetical protein